MWKTSEAACPKGFKCQSEETLGPKKSLENALKISRIAQNIYRVKDNGFIFFRL